MLKYRYIADIIIQDLYENIDDKLLESLQRLSWIKNLAQASADTKGTETVSFIKGILYNFKGLLMGITTPRLLFLGMLRFVVVVALTLVCSGFILMWHQEILSLLWSMPESSKWSMPESSAMLWWELIFWWCKFFLLKLVFWCMLILWKLVSWLFSLVLAVIAGLLSYFIAQLLFGIFIMDYMSIITEQKITGRSNGTAPVSGAALFIHLIRQEIPRVIIPVFLMFIIMILGFLTPLGPVIAIISSIVAAVFLAWDNTDLVPARRMEPFGRRFRYLKKNLMFHIGFGICFLIPWLNIVLLSFAPVGATLYYIENDVES